MPKIFAQYLTCKIPSVDQNPFSDIAENEVKLYLLGHLLVRAEFQEVGSTVKVEHVYLQQQKGV